MPPSAVKTIKDLIFWQYAKLISKSAGFGIDGRQFQMSCFIKLKNGNMKWSSVVKEWLREHEKHNKCIYCSSKENLSTEHILPLSREGPDIPSNVIRICKKCNSKKGGKRLYEWFTIENKDIIPRIAEGKYLKLLYELHSKKGTLDINQGELKKLCIYCDMNKLCEKANKKEKLNVYCLEGIFNKFNK